MSVTRSVRYLVFATPLVASALVGCGDAASGPEFQSLHDVQARAAALTDRDEVRGGAVYAMTNAVGNNAIVVYRRAADGTLALAGAPVPTGGGGSGVQLDSTDSLGSQGALMFDPKQRLSSRSTLRQLPPTPRMTVTRARCQCSESKMMAPWSPPLTPCPREGSSFTRAA